MDTIVIKKPKYEMLDAEMLAVRKTLENTKGLIEAIKRGDYKKIADIMSLQSISATSTFIKVLAEVDLNFVNTYLTESFSYYHVLEVSDLIINKLSIAPNSEMSVYIARSDISEIIIDMKGFSDNDKALTCMEYILTLSLCNVDNMRLKFRNKVDVDYVESVVQDMFKPYSTNIKNIIIE